MTQQECQREPLLALLNDYLPFRKIGDWKEEKADGRKDAGFYLEFETAPEGWGRYAQVSYAMLDEQEETAPLMRGEEVWLRIAPEELQHRI